MHLNWGQLTFFLEVLLLVPSLQLILLTLCELLGWTLRVNHMPRCRKDIVWERHSRCTMDTVGKSWNVPAPSSWSKHCVTSYETLLCPSGTITVFKPHSHITTYLMHLLNICVPDWLGCFSWCCQQSQFSRETCVFHCPPPVSHFSWSSPNFHTICHSIICSSYSQWCTLIDSYSPHNYNDTPNDICLNSSEGSYWRLSFDGMLAWMGRTTWNYTQFQMS